MPALDTRILVRYIVQDDAAQLAAAKRLISRIVAEGSTLFIPVTVVLALEWVLRSRFGSAPDSYMIRSEIGRALVGVRPVSAADRAIARALRCDAGDRCPADRSSPF
jgi:predicted nucleic acid-binding protein